MRIVFFSTKPSDERFFTAENEDYGYELVFLEAHLGADTVSLAKNADAVCVFVNDTVDADVIEALKNYGIRTIALRCAGYNNVDLEAAKAAGITVAHVPAYSPFAVAEHTVGMMLSLNRKYHKAYNRVREGNFALDGLLGFDLNDKTAGIIGMGKIGQITAKILSGFGCHVIAYDKYADQLPDDYVTYTDLDTVFQTSDIITLHCPLTPDTYHLIDEDTIATMKDGVMIVNTSRGGLIDTRAVITGLKSKKIGWLGLDVYEEESDMFFENLSQEVIQDDVFSRLLTFPNVLITGHQAFFTKEALTNIAGTTLSNLRAIESGDKNSAHLVGV